MPPLEEGTPAPVESLSFIHSNLILPAGVAEVTASSDDLEQAQAKNSLQLDGGQREETSDHQKTRLSLSLSASNEPRSVILSSTSDFHQVNHTRSSGIIGDDYPSKWKHLDPDSNIDDWALYVRYCTSFVAHRLSTVNGFELPKAYGNAEAWGGRARSEGYKVNNMPIRGAVAWSAAAPENWGYGHVAWVAAVNGDLVTVEEYNYGNRHAYHSRTVHKSAFTGYIHFKELIQRQTTANPAPVTPSTHDLPAQGTYTFKQVTGVKNEPIQSSPNRAFYDIGEKVNYDRVLENDNHLWLSYINFSGSRSYVAIRSLIPPSAPSPVTTSSLPPRGSYQFTQTTPIKNQASMSSTTIAYYHSGERVNYDRVLVSEGRQWISYLSFSGVRRYIPLT